MGFLGLSSAHRPGKVWVAERLQKIQAENAKAK
jgi:hypothetical protein